MIPSRYSPVAHPSNATSTLSPQSDGVYNDDHFDIGLSIAFQLPVSEIRRIISLRYGDSPVGDDDDVVTASGPSIKDNQHMPAELASNSRDASDADPVSASVMSAKVAIFDAWQGRAAGIMPTSSGADNTSTAEAQAAENDDREIGDTLVESSPAAAARVADFHARMSNANAKIFGPRGVSGETADFRDMRVRVSHARAATARSKAAKTASSQASRTQASNAGATNPRAVDGTATASGAGLRTASTSTSKTNGMGTSLSGGARNPIDIDEDSPVDMTPDVTAPITGSYNMENIDPALFANTTPVHKASHTNQSSSEALQTDYLPTSSMGFQPGNIGQVSSVNAENDQSLSEGLTQLSKSPEQSDINSLFEEQSSDEATADNSILSEVIDARISGVNHFQAAPLPKISSNEVLNGPISSNNLTQAVLPLGQSDLSPAEEDTLDEEEFHRRLCEEFGTPPPEQSDLDSLFEEEEDANVDEEAGTPPPEQSDQNSPVEEETLDEEEFHRRLCKEFGTPPPEQSDLDTSSEEE